MDSLYQRLKELDPDTFQRFCFQLLKERHPGQDLKHVEGASGDEGLDLVSGALNGNPAIWQCKAFREGVGESQKAKIKESLKTALRHFSPSCWILCLSVDMDVKTLRWFGRLKASYKSKVTIGELFASEIVNELLHRRSLRNQFFPGASLDVNELKRMVARTGDMSLEELEHVTDANLEDIIERWKERDARFNYQIVSDGDLGPPSTGNEGVTPGLVVSMSRGGKTVNVFARDVASLRANPPQITTTLSDGGRKKFETFLRTGIPQEFETDEIERVVSDWSLMSDLTKSAGLLKMKLATSSALTNRKRHVRVDFVGTGGRGTVRYDLMEMRPVRMGTEVFEFSLSGRNLPFKMFFVLSNPPAGSAAITTENDWVGRDTRSIKKSLDALDLLYPSGEIHIYDLESEKAFLDGVVSLKDHPERSDRFALITDLGDIGDQFDADLRMPETITREDWEVIYLLKQIISNGTVELSDISFVLVKSEENRELVPQQLRSDPSGKYLLKYLSERFEPLPKLFGKSINTGPIVIEADVQFNDLPSLLKSFAEAAIGNGVRVSVRPLGPVRVARASASSALRA